MKYTKEYCNIESLKYNSRIEFYNKNSKIYNYSCKHKWIDEICSHMCVGWKSNRWTKEKCKLESYKYKTRSELMLKNRSCYDFARKNKWLDEICSHMIENQISERCLYCFEFSDNTVYIGLTKNIEIRKNFHYNNSKSSVYRKIKKTSIMPRFSYGDYEPQNIAKNKEIETIEKYKNSGWRVLNKTNGGELGMNKLYWTKEKCQEESSKYFKRNDFQKYSSGAYSSARKNKWLDEICSHMKELNLWTKEKCQEEAQKYNHRSELQKYSSGAYSSARKNKWLDEICSHMIEIRKPNGYWTKEKCQEEALKYNTKNDFINKSQSCYCICLENKWLIDICSHMVKKEYKKYWTKEKCQEEALKYNTKNEFRKNSRSAYNAVLKNKWMICLHF
jgi:predicted GIY-YIG superfamily endonuclease